MSYKTLAKLDDLNFRLKCNTEIVNCIHEALRSGDKNEGYADAVFGMYLHFDEMQKEMCELIDTGYKEIRKEDVA